MPNKPKRTAKSYRSLKDLGVQQLRELLPNKKLDNGSHDDPGEDTNKNGDLCLMEAVAYITGEPHSDHPSCADPALTNIAISFNDSHYNYRERDNLIPAIPALVGSRTGSARVRWKRAKALAVRLVSLSCVALENEFSEAPSRALINELEGIDLVTKDSAKRALEILQTFECDNETVQETQSMLDTLVQKWNATGLSAKSYEQIMPTALHSIIDSSYDQADLLQELGRIRD